MVEMVLVVKHMTLVWPIKHRQQELHYSQTTTTEPWVNWGFGVILPILTLLIQLSRLVSVVLTLFRYIMYEIDVRLHREGFNHGAEALQADRRAHNQSCCWSTVGASEKYLSNKHNPVIFIVDNTDNTQSAAWCASASTGSLKTCSHWTSITRGS